MNVLTLAESKIKLKRSSNTYGGEYHGPCPDCGGKDRFHVWPQENNGQGSYWCRSCEKAGDNIQFLRDFEGLSYREACNRLNIVISDSKPMQPSPHIERGGFVPRKYELPSETWQNRAQKLTIWACENLLKNKSVSHWLLNRGITEAGIRRHWLGWNPGENGKDIFRSCKAWGLPEIIKDNGKLRALWIPVGLVIPYIYDGRVARIRIRRPEVGGPDDPRYYVLPGSSMKTMILEPDRRAFIVVESELDAVMISQYPQIGAVALGSVSAKPDVEVHDVLRNCLQILVSLDFDDPGAKAMQWWSEKFDNCERWPVPAGKDPGEAHQLGVDIDKWIKTGLPPAMMIEKEELKIEDKKAESKKNKWRAINTDAILELHGLLLKNPSVRIINTPERFTVLRNGKYVGGRINELVFHTPEVTRYIMEHPADEITGENLLR